MRNCGLIAAATVTSFFTFFGIGKDQADFALIDLRTAVGRVVGLNHQLRAGRNPPASGRRIDGRRHARSKTGNQVEQRFGRIDPILSRRMKEQDQVMRHAAIARPQLGGLTQRSVGECPYPTRSF